MALAGGRCTGWTDPLRGGRDIEVRLTTRHIVGGGSAPPPRHFLPANYARTSRSASRLYLAILARSCRKPSRSAGEIVDCFTNPAITSQATIIFLKGSVARGLPAGEPGGILARGNGSALTKESTMANYRIRIL